MENATSCTGVVQRVRCDKTKTNNGIESVHMIIQDYANEKKKQIPLQLEMYPYYYLRRMQMCPHKYVLF